jgi:hypothetical protein
MKFIIKKGRRKPLFWFFSFRLWFLKRSISRLVRFDHSANYDLPGTEDDPDVNKLFGIGYLWDHHIDSARFGWNYDQIAGKVNIFAYIYVNGVRSFTKICQVNKFNFYRMTLLIKKGMYVFMVNNPKKTEEFCRYTLDFSHRKKFSIKLGLYFGGSKPAPHDISIEIKRK